MNRASSLRRVRARGLQQPFAIVGRVPSPGGSWAQRMRKDRMEALHEPHDILVRTTLPHPALSQKERENNRPVVGNIERLFRFRGPMRENLFGRILTLTRCSLSQTQPIQ